jgi:hypothetical protein
MVVCRSTIERKTPRRMRWRVILEKKFSTALSHEAEVGVKWKVQRAVVTASTPRPRTPASVQHYPERCARPAPGARRITLPDRKLSWAPIRSFCVRRNARKHRAPDLTRLEGTSSSNPSPSGGDDLNCPARLSCSAARLPVKVSSEPIHRSVDNPVENSRAPEAKLR